MSGFQSPRYFQVWGLEVEDYGHRYGAIPAGWTLFVLEPDLGSFVFAPVTVMMAQPHRAPYVRRARPPGAAPGTHVHRPDQAERPVSAGVRRCRASEIMDGRLASAPRCREGF